MKPALQLPQQLPLVLWLGDYFSVTDEFHLLVSLFCYRWLTPLSPIVLYVLCFLIAIRSMSHFLHLVITLSGEIVAKVKVR